MSLSYRRRKEARLREKMVEGEAQLRLTMKKKPEQFPRFIFGVQQDGQFFQKAFPKKGTYTAKGHGKTLQVTIRKTFPCISTIAYYRSTIR